MVASLNTSKEIMRVVLQHVDEETAKKIFAELKTVQGNQSFVDTITRLETLLLKLPKVKKR